MNTEIIAALVAGAFAIQAAAIGAVGIIVARLIKRETETLKRGTESVRNEVTPNGGRSAHDRLVEHIDNVRIELSRKVDHVNSQHVKDWHQ